jgi:hypothetical protein
MIDSGVLDIGIAGSLGRGGRAEDSAEAPAGFTARLLGRLISRSVDDEAMAQAATDRELAKLVSESPERRFDQGKAQALALKSGFSGGWLS